VSFGVEDKLVERQNAEIITEQQVQVLQGFRQVERLQFVRVLRVQNVRYRCVALGKLRVLLERTEDAPAPRAVDWVLRQPIHVEQTLHGLRPMDVVPVIELLRRHPTTRLRQPTK